MILWDHEGKPVVCDHKDLTPGVLTMISGISDRFDRGVCPFCNRSYSQELSCHHLRNILIVEGDAYWHRTFINISGTRFLSASNDDGLDGPAVQHCETCASLRQKVDMIHVRFTEEDDPRIRVVSYCSDTCAAIQWQSNLKVYRQRQNLQKWLRDSDSYTG
ncbi:hypothetical protein [Geobacter sp. SVR]|uniref:hypothetical protein n=1 Tax=Geobacter sp. SVR TaxID=2495594 RepID=UPI00143F022B|nr:hypothetical protein [Geobacter sp. SVR]BCS51820.1 hypothetical protein GSVR_01280 [Geobacter sp. SVR]GCF86993.1 hypothetical protein GSbR_35930 [Geobacter sp. SVR]